MLGAAIAGLLAGFAYLLHTRLPQQLDSSELGRVRVYPAWLRTRGFTYVFSGERGWGAPEETVAREFARHGQLVVGIDSPQFLNWSNGTAGGCVYLPGQLENFSRARQRAANLGEYLEPALLGQGQGAALVYMTQLQAPALAFSAAVALDPQPTLALKRPFCDHAAAASDGSALTLAVERPGSNVPLRIAIDATASAGQRQFAASLSPPNGPAAVTSGPFVTYRDALSGIEQERERSDLADLPLVELPAAQPTGAAFAILYSGDGGWRDLDRTLAGVLAQKGINVVGVDVLRYFWKKKAPGKAAADLARIMAFYQQRWHQQQVLLIGFSFGAQVLPFMINRLPADLRADIRAVSLLSPEPSTAFEVEPSGWFGRQSDATIAIVPELIKLSGFPVQCIYGEDEAGDSLCTQAVGPGVQAISKQGGHHFDQDYGALADQILAALPH